MIFYLNWKSKEFSKVIMNYIVVIAKNLWGTVRLFNELPETFECELCHSELSSIENSFLIYMVVRDD